MPCGIADRPVTSLAEEGIDVRCARSSTSSPRLRRRALGAAASSSARTSRGATGRRPDLSAVLPRRRPRRAGPSGRRPRLLGRLAQAGVTAGLSISDRKPEWLRPKVHHGPEVLALKRTVRDLGLVTVCEDAGCPNLSRVLGRRHGHVHGARRALHPGVRLLPRRHAASPLAPEADEPARVAEAVDRMGLDHAVLTMVARDDLADGGMAHVAACVEAIRQRRAGDAGRDARVRRQGRRRRRWQLLFAARPDVFNHNVETVARLQRAVRPSAGYARSLGVLARAKAAGLVTKTGLHRRPGRDRRRGRRLPRRPRRHRRRHRHDRPVPAARRRTTCRSPGRPSPPSSPRWKQIGEALGIGHVEASPLTRSSYHARAAADAVATPVANPAFSDPVQKGRVGLSVR